MTYKEIVGKIKELNPFAFIRIGDGEMLCADGVKGENCDGHKYFPELGEAILSVLKTPRENIVMGLQPESHGLYKSKAPYKQNWVNADILHTQSEKGGLKELMEALTLHKKKVTVVGPSHLDMGFNHIKVKKTNAWEQYDQIQKKVETVAKRSSTQIILFSCGMMKVPLIEYLSRKYPDNIYIDTGSVFDPYFGVNSRSYHERVNKELI